jgi:hypothetical protein
MRAGPGDFELRLRYGWLARRAAASAPRVELAGAVALMDLCHRRQVKAQRRAVRLYADSFNLLDATTVFTLRLLLRVLRRRRDGPAQFAAIIAAMTAPQVRAWAAE